MRVSITIPVYNEEKCLANTLKRFHDFLSSRDFGWDWEIVVPDNGSTDRTLEVANQFRIQNSEFKMSAVRIPEKGRGRALKHVWLSSEADVLVYMDADLSTELEALPALVESVLPETKIRGGVGAGFNHYDIATGSRLLRPELTTRSVKREFISRCYNRLIKLMFPSVSFSDAQCGFKAITRSAAQALLPQVHDNEWFFDTELLILAQHQGYRIFDLPVRWTERRETHVKILRTAIQDIKGLLRLRHTLRTRSPAPKTHSSPLSPIRH